MFLKSIFLIIILEFFKIYFGIINLLLQILLLIFSIIILLVSFREKKDELFSSQENLKNIEEVTH